MGSPARAVEAFAPAKVNLFLHVGPVDVEGYHPICSLGVFADIGDRLSIGRADEPSLTVTGPFADQIPRDGGNLVMRALRGLAPWTRGEPPRLAVILDKQLPAAAGLGGGSSDAGAALRAARQVLALPVSDAELEAVAFAVGADGPLCLWSEARLVGGRGERLWPAPRMPRLPAVLVNPGAPSLTAAVYRAYDDGPLRTADVAPPPSAFDDVSSVIAWLSRQRNDLEAPALRLQPAIGPALDAVRASGAPLTRLSGSGATVFGLFPTCVQARHAALEIRAAHPEWWVQETSLH